MKRAIYIGLGVVLVALVMVGCSRKPTGPEYTNHVNISVVSNPEGAEIWLDHENTGEVTPFTFTNVEWSYHDLRLRKEGYFPWETTTSGEYGETIQISASLTQAPQKLVTYSEDYNIWDIGLDSYSMSLIRKSENEVRGIEWSPNGEYLAYMKYEGYTVLRSNGIVEAEINFSKGIRWSNDSSTIVSGKYVDGIYAYYLSTSELRRILETSGFTYDHNPAFSPDDTKIAYAHHEYGYSAWIRLMDADGSNSQTVSPRFTTMDHDEEISLQWISDHQLLFAIKETGVYLLDISTGNLHLVIEGDVRDLKVSPDRSRYAVSIDYELYCGIVGNWTPEFLNDFAGQIAWNTDSQSFAFVNSRGVFWATLDGFIAHIFDFWEIWPVYHYGVSVKPN